MSNDKIQTTKKALAKTKQKDWLKKLENATGAGIDLNRKPRTVYLLIDCSGSMDDKMYQAISGGKEFAEQANKKNYLTGLIKFNNQAELVTEPQRDLAVFNRQIEKLDANGGTNMSSAIQIAADRFSELKGDRVICIVTDGFPDNAGKTLEAAEKAKGMGIDIMTIGTDDADREFLAKLASRSELSNKVERKELKAGISDMARLLKG